MGSSNKREELKLEAIYHPGLEGVIAAVTRISFLDVDHGQILVRGYDLIELARKKPYLDVAYLLFYEKLPNEKESQDFEERLREWAKPTPLLEEWLKRLPSQMHPMDVQRTLLSLLAGFEDPKMLLETTVESNLSKGIKILGQLPWITANLIRALEGLPLVQPDLSLNFSERFLQMILNRPLTKEEVEVFDRTLTCYIDCLDFK
jgi:citrate synthase